MIDTNELRRLAQEATPGPWYIGSGIYEGRNIYSVEAVTDDEGFTYNPVVATAEDDEVACWDANARLIAAANPAVISELLDRLEAAESECLEQSRLNGMGASREAALITKLEAAEKELAELRSSMKFRTSLIGRTEAERDDAKAAAENIALKLDYLRSKLETAKNAQNDWLRANAPGGWIDNLRVENEALHAKITEMERQEPARLVTPTAYRWRYRGAVKWQYGELTEETVQVAKEHNHEIQSLGVLPGAQGEEK